MKSKIQITDNEKLNYGATNTPFFSSAGQRKASRALTELLNGSLNLVYITGGLGTGKTRLLNDYVSSVNTHAKIAVLSERLDSPMEFLHSVAVSFDGIIHGETTQDLHSSLIDFLIEQHQQEEQFVLAVDNAHELSEEVFELLQSLSELESRDTRILNIVLLARNGAKINRKIRELTFSADLSAIACEITPFTEIETRAYISEQLSRNMEFTRLQLTTTGGRRIHYYSGGNPLLINIITHLSAKIALNAEQLQITRKVVQHAIRTHQWVSISESIPGIHIVKVPGSDERGQYAIPKVIVFDENEKISEHELSEDKTWMGRDASSSIHLNQQSVSRRHALITQENGNVWISNLNSINGTQVNSKPVLRRVLLDGDVIRVANFLLLFVYEEAAHSSGHLKEASRSDTSIIEEDLSDDVDNYIELPTALDEEPVPAYAAVHQRPGKSPKSKASLITVSTIASLGLITGAIIISQNGIEKFDISFPKGGNIETTPPEITEIIPAEVQAPTQTNEITAAKPIVLTTPSKAETTDATLDTGLAGLATENDVAVESVSLPSAPVAPASEAIVEAPMTPTAPIETIAKSTAEEVVPMIAPVQEIFSPETFVADSDAVITDTRFVEGEKAEAGFSDLVFASPASNNLYVKDEYKFDNSALLSDRSYDSVTFDWNDIDQLLQRGQQQIASLKLTIPADDNAYDTYKTVLSLDSGNQEALDGLNFIAERYQNLAIASKDRFNFDHALKMSNRGLEVVPNHSGLLSLQDELAVLAANNQSHSVAIEKVSEQELNQRYNIEKVPENELNQNYNIARVSDSEMDALYSASATPQFIEPLQAPRSFVSSESSQPIFVNNTASVEPVITVSTYVPPVAIAQPTVTTQSVVPTPQVVATVTQQPVAQPIAIAPQVATAAAQVSVQPAAAVAQPTAPKVAVAPAPAPKQVIPTYLKPGSSNQTAASLAPKPAPVSSETILNVDHLLKKASRLQSIGHYTGPAGENALDTYKRILSLEPMNPDALIGLLDIADYYHRESEKLMLLGDPLSSLAMIEEGLKVRPDHKGLRQLQTNAQLLLSKEGKERGIGNQRLSRSDRKAAKASRHIEKLVTDARDRLNEKEYSKSLSIIEQGLKLDPDNPELISIRSDALHSLANLEKKWGQEQKLREQNLARQQRVKYEVNEKKAERLLSKARKDYQQGNYQAALKSARTGLIVMPEHIELIALQQKIESSWDRTTRTQANKAVSSVVSGIVAKAKKTHASGDSAATMRLIETGLTIDPSNVDLKVLKLEIEKTREIELLKQQANAKLQELEKLKQQAKLSK